MTNVEKLAAKMQADGFTIGGMTLGPNATPEAVGGEILRSLEEIENGEADIIFEFED